MARNKSGIRLFILMLIFSGNVFAQEIGKESRKKSNIEAGGESLEIAKKVNNLTVFSESNMTYPLVKIARLYSSTGNSAVSINFNSSYDLIQNIDIGEPSDIFISSHSDWIDRLKQKGLVDVYSLSNIAKDRLVLVTSKSNNKVNSVKINQQADIKEIFKEMNNQRATLIVDSALTSLGKYTDVILKENGMSSQRIYRKTLEDKKPIIDFISENNEYFGIVLASAVKNYDNIVVLRTIDSDIYYQALVIAGTNMDKARDFLKFIKSDAAKNVFAENGFVVE
jgi:molybdate transport system substrate-binding protein